MAAKNQVDKYLEALERLKARGDTINKDAVAKEAGSGKGSIKKSRSVYADLIAAIDQAALEQKQTKAAADPAPQLKQQIATLQQRLDSALEREVCLLNEVYHLREEVRQLAKRKGLTVASDMTR
jgi:hypothetical protein